MITSVSHPAVHRTLAHQAPPGAALTRTSSAGPQEVYNASEEAPSEKPDTTKYIVTGVGLALALGITGAAVWWASQMPEPEMPKSSIFDVETQPQHQEHSQPGTDWNTRGSRGDWNSGPRTHTPSAGSQVTPPHETTRLDSNGRVTVPLGNGLSVDSNGEVGVQVGNTTIRTDGTADFQVSPNMNLRTDGTVGFRLNENMTLRSDGSVEWHLGGRR